MRRAAAAIRALTVALVVGAVFGAIEGVLAEGLPGESWASRVGGLVLLDSVLLGLPLGVILVAVAVFRAPRARRGTPAAVLVLLLLLGSGGWRLAGVLGELELGRLQSWHLERPLPVLRSDDGPAPIVLISVDTLRADRVAEMPRLSAWAAQGVHFTHARTSSPWTLPSLATLHTGLPAGVHGAGRRVTGRAAHHRTGLGDVATLAEVLRTRGYVTGAVVTNPFAGARYGFARGFDRFHDLTHRTLRQRALRRGVLLRGWVPPAGDTADRVTDRTLTLIERGGQGRLFAWVHYLDAHAPYAEQPAGFDPYGDCDLPACFDDWRAVRAGLFNPGEPERDFVRDLYDADVAWLDGELGRLLDGLEAQGVMDRALVVLVGDHGEELWDHDGGEHGGTFYDEVVRVPLIVWAPGAAPGVDERAVGLGAVHQGLAAFSEGRGLGPLAPGVAAAPVALVSRLFGPEAAGCTDGRHKLVVEGDGTERLFDLEADPGETAALVAPDPAVVEGLRACTPSVLVEAADDGAEGDVSVLQALGYVE